MIVLKHNIALVENPTLEMNKNCLTQLSSFIACFSTFYYLDPFSLYIYN